jgi:hypothetical protein
MGIEWKWLRLIGQTPTPFPGGQGAFIHHESQITVGGRTEKIQAVSVVYMKWTGIGQWLYYTSTVSAPSAHFARDLPVLLEIWKSWKVDDRVFQERLQKALESLRECHRIVQGVVAERSRVMSRANADWSEVLRGTSWVHDRRFGELTERSSYGLDKVVERFNRREGYERWKIIPLKDLLYP